VSRTDERWAVGSGRRPRPRPPPPSPWPHAPGGGGVDGATGAIRRRGFGPTPPVAGLPERGSRVPPGRAPRYGRGSAPRAAPRARAPAGAPPGDPPPHSARGGGIDPQPPACGLILTPAERPSLIRRGGATVSTLPRGSDPSSSLKTQGGAWCGPYEKEVTYGTQKEEIQFGRCSGHREGSGVGCT